MSKNYKGKIVKWNNDYIRKLDAQGDLIHRARAAVLKVEDDGIGHKMASVDWNVSGMPSKTNVDNLEIANVDNTKKETNFIQTWNKKYK